MSIQILRPVKVIAIDGPSGSGKSTIAKKLAEKLSLVYLDTGALYRSIAFGLNQANIADDEDSKIADYLNNMQLEYGVSQDILIKLNGEDLTAKIREHDVSALASKYSKNSIIRDFLKKFQRQLADEKGAVLEGRDIGTVIFPDAALKFFLTASPVIRATRRFEQLKELGQDVSNTSIEQIAADIEERDNADKGREIAPLQKAPDAIEIDTGPLRLNDVLLKMMSEYIQKQDSFK